MSPNGAVQLSPLINSSFHNFMFIHRGPSINYVITLEGGGGCEMMMVDDVRGRGSQNMMMSSLF